MKRRERQDATGSVEALTSETAGRRGTERRTSTSEASQSKKLKHVTGGSPGLNEHSMHLDTCGASRLLVTSREEEFFWSLGFPSFRNLLRS